MAPSSGGQSSQQGDNSLAPFWVICGLFALGWGLWYFAHEQIASVLLYIRLAEAELIGLFTNNGIELSANIQSLSPADVDFKTLKDISINVGEYLRYPVIILIILFAVVIYLSKATARYKKTYSMQRLVEEESTVWPQITPIMRLNLVNADIDVGPWAMAMTPMQFAKKYHLLQEERILTTDAVTTLQRAKTVVTLRRDEAYQAFSLQIGRYWAGVEHLNSHTKALFAVCAARAGHDQDGARKLLMHIAASTAKGKLDFSGTQELLTKHQNNKTVIKITQSRAFVLTVMASMLALAREGGVLASADFLWLKPIDRPLWFILNSIGRQTPFVEAAGPFAHWLAERKMERRLSVPMVEEAVINSL